MVYVLGMAGTENAEVELVRVGASDIPQGALDYLAARAKRAGHTQSNSALVRTAVIELVDRLRAETPDLQRKRDTG